MGGLLGKDPEGRSWKGEENRRNCLGGLGSERESLVKMGGRGLRIRRHEIGDL